MTAVYYSSWEVWSLHSLSAFTSTSRFTDPDIEEAGEGVCFAHPSTLGLVWVRKKGVGLCPIIVNIGITCTTYFFLVNSFADNYIYFMYKCMSLRLFPIFSEPDTCTVYVGILKFLHIPFKIQCKLAHADRCLISLSPFMPPLFILQVHVYKAVTLTWIYLIAFPINTLKWKQRWHAFPQCHKLRVLLS